MLWEHHKARKLKKETSKLKPPASDIFTYQTLNPAVFIMYVPRMKLQNKIEKIRNRWKVIEVKQ